jgi:hypothetical protein
MRINNRVARWSAVEPFMNADWDARQESAAQIAGRLGPTMTAIGAVFGGGLAWEGDEPSTHIDPDNDAELERIIQEAVYRDDDGDLFPQKGFQLSVSGRRRGYIVSLRLGVGSSVSGRNRPSNRIHVKFNSGPRSVDVMESTLLVVATWWQPASIAATDHDTITLTGDMVRFAPAIGQRMWLRDDVGTISSAPAGVRVEPIGGGTLLATDDDWTPQQAVDALKTTLADNNITTIPRGPQPRN